MGWIGCLVVASEREPGYLDSCPPHRPEQAEALAQGLYSEGCYRPAGVTSFDGVLYPRHGHIGIGAYDGAAIVTDAGLFDTGPTGGPLAERMLELYTGQLPQVDDDFEQPSHFFQVQLKLTEADPELLQRKQLDDWWGEEERKYPVPVTLVKLGPGPALLGGGPEGDVGGSLRPAR